MNKLNFTSKSNGDILNASEWNAVVSKTDELVQAINDGAGSGSSSGSGEVDTNGVVSVNSKGNTTISSTKHINIEPAYVTDGGSGTYGDVQIKPGDDITLESHHRAEDKRDEITIKTSNGQDGASKAPVKLQVIAADMTLSTKGKQVASGSNDSPNVMNVNVTTGSGKGYLKVRAQAIDLRCEEHGGIAIQPKGNDNLGYENKIKFEHGGGDGLEFGTFNTEKTSIFTDEYRFNKDGVWKMSTRHKEDSDKSDGVDDTTFYKYAKNNAENNESYSESDGITYEASDDFYDFIDVEDPQCTTKDIIKTAYAMNGGKDRHTKITNKGAIEIATNTTYTISETSEPEDATGVISVGTISQKVASDIANGVLDNAYNEGDFTTLPDTTKIYSAGGGAFFEFVEVPAPSIKIESGNELKLGGILDFGSSFNFGETDNGIEVQNKYTKKGTLKDCGKLKVIAVNNNSSAHTFNTLWDPTANSNNGGSVTETTVSVPAGESMQIAEASIYDIIKLVNYMKDNNQGPWANL